MATRGTTRWNRVRRTICLLIGVVAVGGVGAAPAQAAFTAQLVGSTATFTGDAAAFDFVVISKSGGELRHNLPGFASDADFDSTAPGVQTLADGPASQVVINAGDGIDNVQLGFAGTVFQTVFTVDGGPGTDFLSPPGLSGAADTVALSGGSVTGAATGGLAYTTMEQVTIRTGGGDDVVDLDATTGAQTIVFGEGGDDRLRLADGTSLSGGIFRGGDGRDTLDYSAWTAPVSVDLGKTARFVALLNGASEVPPTGSAATADGILEFTDLPTGKFDYELTVDGLTSAQITDAHIHAGAPGANGAVIFPIGPASGWTDPGGPFTEAFNQTDTDITEPALRGGNTYFNVHTGAFPAGEIRGQLTLDPDNGYGGPATGMQRVQTVEDVIGGSGADTLRGNLLANFLDGRGGADTLNCGDGADTETSDLADTLTSCETIVGASATVTGVDPASPADNLTPRVKGTASPAGLTVRIYTNATCTGAPAATGSVADFAGAGIAVPVADGSTTTFHAAVADTANQSACSTSSVTYEETVTPTPTPTPSPTPTATATPTPAATPAPSPAATPTPAPAPTPVGSVSAIKPKASGKGAQITIDTGSTAACPATATGSCKATATATAKVRSGRRTRTTTLGRVTATVTRGKSTRVKVKLSRSASSTWRRTGRLRITFTIRLTVPGGKQVTRTRAVSLKPPARK